jgi:3-deoxy-7-phosphoheptulonate synthase
MEEDRLKLLATAKKVLGLPIVTEVMNLCGIDLVAKYVDVIQEFLMSAKYNHSEHGTRTFETATRNILDISCIPALKQETHLPIIVDPSPCNWT